MAAREARLVIWAAGAKPGSSDSAACRADRPLSGGRPEVECAAAGVVAVVVVAAAGGVRRSR